MEDVKEHFLGITYPAKKPGFNPCFNGRCKRTPPLIKIGFSLLYVSILVLMEDVKELFIPVTVFQPKAEVSILVLMEDVKEPQHFPTNRHYVDQFQSLF